jgi:penicillin-binding protein 2
MDKPKIAIAVFIENAKGGGGLWAAPTASLMIEKYINGKVSETEREETILKANFSY